MSGRHRRTEISDADRVNARDVRSDLNHDIRDLIRSAVEYLVTDLSYGYGDKISTTDAYRAMNISELLGLVGKRRPIRITVGDSRGVFYDLFDEAEAKTLTEKSHLMIEMRNTILDEEWSDAEAAARIGATLEEVDAIKDGKIDAFELDRVQDLARQSRCI